MTANLEDMLDAIEKAGGDEQSIAHELAKSLTGNFGKLIDVLAKAVPTDEEDEEYDEDPDEEGDMDEDEDDDAPGFTDMQMGQTGPTGKLDVTNWLFRVGTKIEALESAHAQITDLQKAVVAQREEISELKTMLAQALESQMGALAPLAKGVIDLTERLSEVPEVVTTPRRRPASRPSSQTRFAATPTAPAARPTPSGTNPAYIGGDQRGEKIRLAKALQGNIIDASQRRRYHLTGRFEDDEAADAAIRQRIEAL